MFKIIPVCRPFSSEASYQTFVSRPLISVDSVWNFLSSAFWAAAKAGTVFFALHSAVAASAVGARSQDVSIPGPSAVPSASLTPFQTSFPVDVHTVFTVLRDMPSIVFPTVPLFERLISNLQGVNNELVLNRYTVLSQNSFFSTEPFVGDLELFSTLVGIRSGMVSSNPNRFSSIDFPVLNRLLGTHFRVVRLSKDVILCPNPKIEKKLKNLAIKDPYFGYLRLMGELNGISPLNSLIYAASMEWVGGEGVFAHVAHAGPLVDSILFPKDFLSSVSDPFIALSHMVPFSFDSKALLRAVYLDTNKEAPVGANYFSFPLILDSDQQYRVNTGFFSSGDAVIYNIYAVEAKTFRHVNLIFKSSALKVQADAFLKEYSRAMNISFSSVYSSLTEYVGLLVSKLFFKQTRTESLFGLGAFTRQCAFGCPEFEEGGNFEIAHRLFNIFKKR